MNQKKKKHHLDDTNQKTHWETYRVLQKKVDQAWMELQRDIESKADMKKLTKDRNELMLLLGECNYLTKEFMNQIERHF